MDEPVERHGTVARDSEGAWHRMVDAEIWYRDTACELKRARLALVAASTAYLAALQRVGDAR